MRSTASSACAWRGEAKGVRQSAKNKSVPFSAFDASAFRAFLAKLRAKDWVVYAKAPFGGPEQVLAYLGRYIHRIAITNERSSLARTARSASVGATTLMATK